MKRYRGWALLVASLLLFSFRSVLSLDALTSAIRTGDVEKLSPYLDYRVDIALPDKNDTYSKSQAEMVIRDFFVTHEVTNFQVRQKGENNGFEYCVGLLQTRHGNYRTSLIMKEKGENLFVEEIRFQPVQ